MLIKAKPQLEKDIKTILYDAMKAAYMSTFEDADIDGAMKNSIKEDMEIAANKYADAFSSEACGPMANAIYDFVKSISIMATPKGLVSPTGPVTGAIFMDEHQIM